ncbi:DNA-binding IclR family transcriptional regulator [Rhodoligotrophos appendicifer]|uniref:IclR family transcriptional regulator n=1 Tax=Rhodoligotrophos appendicifer TaxID=987056 RepID=UPI00117E3276|nr:IclR family transcriptional regulator [Rhodoligotrophos appendicifer]
MIVKQVQFAIQILEYFSEHRRPATLSEIADHFGWPRSSTFNLIETLSKSGLLYEPKFRAGYYPTRRLLKLAHEIVADGPLSEDMRIMVSNIAAQTGETAVLAALSHMSAVFVEVVESSSPIRYFAQVGQRVPLHATSAGRALLSMVSAKERAAVLRKSDYIRFAPRALMTAEDVEADIAASMERGWFLNNNGYSPDLLGIAVPVPLKDRQYCLMVAGPAYRTEDRVADLVASLQAEIERFMAGEEE